MTAAPKPKPKRPPLVTEMDRLEIELEVFQLRAERDQLKKTVSVLEQHLKEQQKHMATATAEPKPKVEAKAAAGDILQYQPKEPGSAPVTALVMTVHDDGTFDVKCFMGYCQGTTDVEKVAFADDAEEGKVSKLGAKPKEPEAPKEPPKAEKHKGGGGETH